MGQRKMYHQIRSFRNCIVIVAHPDDETLWAGGTILMYPQGGWTVVTLCRRSDPDRSARFFRAVECLNATGVMGDLDDGPEQSPLAENEVQNAVLSLLPSDRFDLIITHSPEGEYTRHLRHEETAKAVFGLWKRGKLSAEQIWMFAYEDGGGKYLPRPSQNAGASTKLPAGIWQKKYDIITNIYGFGPDSFEAKTTPHQEAFWCLSASQKGSTRFE